MGRANNERPSCSSKAQQIFRSVIGIHHKLFNILILPSKLFSSQVIVLDMGGSMLGYLMNSHEFRIKGIVMALPTTSHDALFRALVANSGRTGALFAGTPYG